MWCTWATKDESGIKIILKLTFIHKEGVLIMILPTGTNSVSDTGIKTEKKSVWKFFPGKFILSWDILIVSKKTLWDCSKSILRFNGASLQYVIVVFIHLWSLSKWFRCWWKHIEFFVFKCLSTSSVLDI